MEALGRLAGVIAHDFNNLLTAIGGYVGMALAEADPQSRMAADLQQVDKAARCASALTHQLLIFSRRQQTVSARPLDLNAEITEMDPPLRRRLTPP